MKHEEFLVAEKLNKDYLKKEQEEQRLIEKTKLKKGLLMRYSEQWETKRTVRAVFNAWKHRKETKK